MITISRTYQVYTQASAEHGEAAESGFYYEDDKVTFRELVQLLADHPIPSCSHGIPDWTTSYPDIDYRTGRETFYSIHPGRDAISQKYWAKAVKAAGITREARQ
jgi:hypothetical protein